MKRLLDKAQDYISAILLISTSLLVFIQVVSRYFFNHSISWSEEIALLMIVWFIFIGCSVAARQGAHVSMDVLENILSKKATKYLSVIVNIISFVFCGIIVYAGIGMVQKAINLNSMATSISMPLWVAYLSVPVGMALMGIQYIFNIVESVQYLKEDSEEVEK